MYYIFNDSGQGQYRNLEIHMDPRKLACEVLHGPLLLYQMELVTLHSN